MIRPYRVTIEGPGIVSIKWRASWEQVRQMQDLLSDERTAEEARADRRRTAEIRFREELQDFVASRAPRNNYERIAVLALFAEKRPRSGADQEAPPGDDGPGGPGPAGPEESSGAPATPSRPAVRPAGKPVRMTRGAIADWFERAGIRPPSNPARDLQLAVERGLVRVSGGGPGASIPSPGDRIRPTVRARKNWSEGKGSP